MTREMGIKGWNVAVLLAIGAIWFCGITQREKRVVVDGGEKIALLEESVAAAPNDTARVLALTQAYLDVRQPGMALASVEHAPTLVRTEPSVEHVYARALLEQGRSADALAAEKRVLARCADPAITCQPVLLASATRRSEILDQLVQLGVEDANAHPEASSLAYVNATRQVTLVP